MRYLLPVVGHDRKLPLNLPSPASSIQETFGSGAAELAEPGSGEGVEEQSAGGAVDSAEGWTGMKTVAQVSLLYRVLCTMSSMSLLALPASWRC